MPQPIQTNPKYQAVQVKLSIQTDEFSISVRIELGRYTTSKLRGKSHSSSGRIISWRCGRVSAAKQLDHPSLSSRPHRAPRIPPE